MSIEIEYAKKEGGKNFGSGCVEEPFADVLHHVGKGLRVVELRAEQGAQGGHGKGCGNAFAADVAKCDPHTPIAHVDDVIIIAANATTGLAKCGEFIVIEFGEGFG